MTRGIHPRASPLALTIPAFDQPRTTHRSGVIGVAADESTGERTPRADMRKFASWCAALTLIACAGGPKPATDPTPAQPVRMRLSVPERAASFALQSRRDYED